MIATLVYILGILGLFFLDRAPAIRTSKALWLPITWLLVNGSRPISVWLQLAPASSPEQYLEGSPLDRNIFLVLIVAGVIVLLKRQRSVARILRVNPTALTFLAYCAVSIIWSDYPEVAFKRWTKSIGDVVMVLIVLTDHERAWAVKRLLSTVGFILIPISVMLIKYYPDMARYYSRWEGRMFVSGVTIDKNMLGMVCLVYGLGAWWRVLTDFQEPRGHKRTQRLAAHGIILAMTVWLFTMADSKTSVACFAMAGGLMTLVSLFRFARKPLMIHLMVATIICICFSVLFLNVGGGALEAMGRNSTLTGRTEIWKGLWPFTGNPLLGTGFESFWLGDRLWRIWASSGYLSGINESHNGYFEIYLNLGWIGVTLLAAIIITGYRNVALEFRQNPNAGALGLACFVATIVYCFTEAAFKMMCPLWVSFLLTTLAVPHARASAASVRTGRLQPVSTGNWEPRTGLGS